MSWIYQIPGGPGVDLLEHYCDYQLLCMVQKVSEILFAILRTRRRGKSSPLLDPVYRILYNYHVYWIFIFTVTKEPSAYSSSPFEL